MFPLLFLLFPFYSFVYQCGLFLWLPLSFFFLWFCPFFSVVPFFPCFCWPSRLMFVFFMFFVFFSYGFFVFSRVAYFFFVFVVLRALFFFLGVFPFSDVLQMFFFLHMFFVFFLFFMLSTLLNVSSRFLFFPVFFWCLFVSILCISSTLISSFSA